MPFPALYRIDLFSLLLFHVIAFATLVLLLYLLKKNYAQVACLILYLAANFLFIKKTAELNHGDANSIRTTCNKYPENESLIQYYFSNRKLVPISAKLPEPIGAYLNQHLPELFPDIASISKGFNTGTGSLLICPDTEKQLTYLMMHRTEKNNFPMVLQSGTVNLLENSIGNVGWSAHYSGVDANIAFFQLNLRIFLVLCGSMALAVLAQKLTKRLLTGRNFS